MCRVGHALVYVELFCRMVRFLVHGTRPPDLEASVRVVAREIIEDGSICWAIMHVTSSRGLIVSENPTLSTGSQSSFSSSSSVLSVSPLLS
jgi:hypothetical protein